MPDQKGRAAALFGTARFPVMVALGALAGLGQAPVDLWPATILALAAFLIFAKSAATARQLAFWSWAFGIGYFGLSLRWIVEPFLVDIARHGWMAPFALVLMSAGAAAFWALAGWFAGRLALRSMALLGLMIAAAEVTRSLILSGFPWALLGHVWVTTPLAQSAAFGGPHLLTVLTILAAWALAMLLARRWLAGIGIVAGFAVAAWVLHPGTAPASPDDAPLVRLVQPNAPQDQKWDPAYRDLFVNRLLTLSAAGEVPDLVVWPETAIPYLLNHIEDDMSLLSGAARGAPLVFGIQRINEVGGFHNAMVVLGPGGQLQGLYDKEHLVPFGEYIPGARLLGRAGAAGLARNLRSGFTPGEGQGPIALPGIGLALPLICYEGIFAEEVQRGPERARLMLLITNDAWFGQAAGPYQHLAQARLRAIEQGLPMVRVANTGITAMIDGKGRIVASLALGEEGAIDVLLPAALSKTVYARFGDLPIILLIFLLAAGVATARGRIWN